MDYNFTLSADDYMTGRSRGLFRMPTGLLPLWEGELLPSFKDTYDTKAMPALAERLGSLYFRNMYAMQMQTLECADLAFPAYRMLFGDILASDWLAMVDWRRNGRDHSVHQPLTAYTTRVLLGGDSDGKLLEVAGTPLVTRIAEIVLRGTGTIYLRRHFAALGVPDALFEENAANLKVWECVVETAAYIAALFHDCGYPWAYRLKQGIGLDKLAGMLTGTSCIEDIYMGLGGRLMMTPFLENHGASVRVTGLWEETYRTIVKEGLTKSHGLPGGIAFCHMTDKCRRGGAISASGAMKLACLEWAALAVVMHDMCDVYWGGRDEVEPINPALRLHAEVDPISCLITLADQLQEFGRNRSVWGRVDDHTAFHSKVKYIEGCVGTKILWEEARGNLAIEYLYEDEAVLTAQRGAIGNIERSLFETSKGFVDLSALEIKSVSMWAERGGVSILRKRKCV